MVNSKVFISYIIPCYNIERYLPKCLDSLRCQVIKEGYEIEFILINDGSTDATFSILETFCSNDNRAILINQKNQGVSAARNYGLKKAHGEYVFFLDGDDCLLNNSSQLLFNICNGNDVDIVVSDAYSVNETTPNNLVEWNLNLGLEPGVYCVNDFLRLSKWLPISFKTYRRKLLIENEVFFDVDLVVGEVFAFFIHAMRFARFLAISKERVMIYSKREGSVMRTNSFDRDITVLKALERDDEYAQLYKRNLLNNYQYNYSVFKSVNSFGVYKYMKAYPYSKEIGQFLCCFKKNKNYRRILKFFVYRKPRFNITTLNSAILLFLPNRYAYELLRFKMKICLLLRS